MTQIFPKPENLASLVLSIRGEKVLLDADLADLYGVETKALNQAVKRNLERFPADFMFQLAPEEWERMRSQIVTSSRRKISAVPYAFTEQGVAMLSSVLRSQRAVEVNIAIMRTFVQLRRLMDSNRDLASKAMEKRYDEQFSVVFDAIKQLIADDQTRKATPPTSHRLSLTSHFLSFLRGRPQPCISANVVRPQDARSWEPSEIMRTN